jgi:hypothetical protein
MSNANVQTGAYTDAPQNEGRQGVVTPEVARDRRLAAAMGVLDLAVYNTYPDLTIPEVPVPDTITATAEPSGEAVAETIALRDSSSLHLIQGTVQKPEWN